MIDMINLIYKGETIKKMATAPKPSPVTKRAKARQVKIRKLTKVTYFNVKSIARQLGEELKTVQGDVRNMVARGELINSNAKGKGYLVKAA